MSARRGPVCINLPRNILADKENFKINLKNQSFENQNSTNLVDKKNFSKSGKLRDRVEIFKTKRQIL